MIALSPEAAQAVALSAQVSGVATLCSLPLAICMAYILARWQFPGRELLNGLVHLPLILPPVVTGYVLLLAFGRQGPIGGALFDLLGITLLFGGRALPWPPRSWRFP